MHSQELKKLTKNINRRKGLTLVGIEDDGSVFEMKMGDDAELFIDTRPDSVVGVYKRGALASEIYDDLEAMK